MTDDTDARLLRAEETLRAVYERVEKTEQIRRFERAPRPQEAENI